MTYLRDRAVVLRSEPFREHDRRVVLFGLQHGLLEAVARGASRKDAKQAGHIVPFSEIEVLIAKGSTFDKVAVATVVESRYMVRRRLGALAFAGAFMDLFERMQRPGIVDEGLYELLLDVLSVADNLPDDPSAERARLLYSAAALKLLDRVGFAPALSSCIFCRESLGEGEAWMLPLDGTIACTDCYRTVRHTHPNADCIQPGTIALLRFLRREPLGRVLLLSGSTDVFASASYAVEHALRQAPLMRMPHGADTIVALLS
jgi:DNA repair protein RecO (recombination protein O)